MENSREFWLSLLRNYSCHPWELEKAGEFSRGGGGVDFLTHGGRAGRCQRPGKNPGSRAMCCLSYSPRAPFSTGEDGCRPGAGVSSLPDRPCPRTSEHFNNSLSTYSMQGIGRSEGPRGRSVSRTCSLRARHYPETQRNVFQLRVSC